MTQFNSHVLIGIIVVIIIIAVIYYLTKNNDQPMQNITSIDRFVNNISQNSRRSSNNNNRSLPPLNPPTLNNRRSDDITDDLVNDLVSKYNVEDRINNRGVGSFAASDPMSEEHGTFNNYGKKRQINMKKMEAPYCDNEYDPRDFSYKKKKFTGRSQEDINDLFDLNKVMPQETQEDWFDVEPLLSTKKIRGTHLIHPKVHMGVNTVGTSLRNATHDIRGDVPNPKTTVSPWNNSTIEPDTNIMGICNPM